jgi:hypothetical protein
LRISRVVQACRWASSGSSAGERLVRPDGVEKLPIAFDFEAELVAVVDLVTVRGARTERPPGD